MPRDLGDVLHYFLPAAEGEDAAPEGPGPPLDRPAALPIVALPIGDHDVVRAAFAWNLAVEMARLGASATLLAPRDRDPSPLWPDPGRGPVGTEVVMADVDGLGMLHRAALDVAVSRAADSSDGGVVLVRMPPEWLRAAQDGRALLRWVLLFATTDPRDQLETFALAKRVIASVESARVGITIHGARRIADAERAFGRIADAATKHVGTSPVSYGLLVDDLHVYRAIVARRPIGLEHPQSRAAKTLRDVARLLLEDARKLAIA